MWAVIKHHNGAFQAVSLERAQRMLWENVFGSRRGKRWFHLYATKKTRNEAAALAIWYNSTQAA